jgi:hypothetical protein
MWDAWNTGLDILQELYSHGGKVFLIIGLLVILWGYVTYRILIYGFEMRFLRPSRRLVVYWRNNSRGIRKMIFRFFYYIIRGIPVLLYSTYTFTLMILIVGALHTTF